MKVEGMVASAGIWKFGWSTSRHPNNPFPFRPSVINFALKKNPGKTCKNPGRNMLQYEHQVTHSPCHSALLAGMRSLICLTLDAKVHDVVTTNGTWTGCIGQAAGQ